MWVQTHLQSLDFPEISVNKTKVAPAPLKRRPLSLGQARAVGAHVSKLKLVLCVLESALMMCRVVFVEVAASASFGRDEKPV